MKHHGDKMLQKHTGGRRTEMGGGGGRKIKEVKMKKVRIKGREAQHRHRRFNIYVRGVGKEEYIESLQNT